MQASTQNCHRFGHPEFVLECDDRCASFLPVLMNWLEESVVHGKVFRPGETVQFGWSVLLVEAAVDGKLTLSELDLSGVPGQRERSVTRTLVFTLKQKYVLQSFGLEPWGNYPSMTQTAVKCNRFAGASEVMLSRTAINATDSGWFFGCIEKHHDHHSTGELMGGSLYELACPRPDVLEFLALPPGTIIVLDRVGRLLSAQNGKDEPLRVEPGSYLDSKRRQEQSG